MTDQAQAIQERLRAGLAAGHTHARCCREGAADRFVTIEIAIGITDWYYFVSTGYPVEVNYNRHAYTPVIVSLSEVAPMDDFRQISELLRLGNLGRLTVS